jgi:hypothetical protein
VKRGTPDHPKVFALLKALGLKQKDRPYVLGVLELLWHRAAAYAPAGDIGKFPDEWIEASLDWHGKPGRLIEALVASQWLDRHNRHRLVVHDWADHADQTVRKKLSSRGLTFVAVTGKKDNFLPEEEYPAGAEPEPEPEPESGPLLGAASHAVEPGGPESDMHVRSIGAALARQIDCSSTTRDPSPEDIQFVRDSLLGYVQNFGLGWPPPDDDICRRVFRGAQGDLQGLAKFLVYLAKERRQCPRRSYGWFVTVIENKVNRAAG